MTFWPSGGFSDVNRAYDRGRDRQAEQLEREYNVWAKRADKLLKALEAWEQDIKLTIADCNKQFHEAEYTKDPRDAVRRIRELNEGLEDLDEELRAYGLYETSGWKCTEKSRYR